MPQEADPGVQLARSLLAEEGGYLEPGVIVNKGMAILDRLRLAGAYAYDLASTLGGGQAVATARHSREAANAIVRYAAARAYAKYATPEYIERIMGKDATLEQRRVAGGVLTEMRLRYMKDALMKAKEEARQEARAAMGRGDGEASTRSHLLAEELLKQAAEVRSIVGADNSPFATEADFQREAKTDRMRQVLENWQQHMKPLMEFNFREAEGMEHDDPIRSLTQMPDLPVNLKAIRAGDVITPTTATVGSAKGNLRNVVTSRLGFARRARGTAQAYDLDIGNIIENSISRGTEAATKNQMMRTLLSEGLAERVRPGERPSDPEMQKIDFVFRTNPKWANEEDAGKENLWVKREAYDDVRRALAPDQALRFENLQAVNGLFTKASLISTVEGLAHVKNMSTMMLRPGMSFVDLFRNAYRFATSNSEFRSRVTELARIGAMKERGPEGGDAGLLWARWFGNSALRWTDPTYGVSRFIDAMQQVMRVTASDAYDRLARNGRIEATEEGRRDFINQLGNYNARTQNRAVAMLRESGFGPFATANTTWLVNSLRELTLSPGVRGKSFGQEVALRAEMLARIAVLPGIAMALNYLNHGRFDGDDNTPYGAVYLGRDDEGRSGHLNLLNLTGVGRGLNSTGLISFINGPSRMQTGRQQLADAASHVMDTALRPAEGPVVNFLHTLGTGRDALGRQIAAPPGQPHDFIDNLRAAGLSANPVVATATGVHHPGVEMTGRERLLESLGPYAPRLSSEADRLTQMYHAVNEERQRFAEQRRRGLAFPQEEAYHILHAFHQAMGRVATAARAEGVSPEDRVRMLADRVRVAQDGLRELQATRR